MTYQVDILDPKADKLLKDLADQNLIAISKANEDPFFQVVEKLRQKASANPPSIEDITREVEKVRAKRYASKSKS